MQVRRLKVFPSQSCPAPFRPSREIFFEIVFYHFRYHLTLDLYMKRS